jgi:hypothetical protein
VADFASRHEFQKEGRSRTPLREARQVRVIHQ